MAKYANPVVLILDEWLLLKPTNAEQRDIFELLHRRRKKSSTIFCLLLLAIEAGDLLDSVKIKLDKSRIRHYEGTIDGERMKELGEKI